MRSKAIKERDFLGMKISKDIDITERDREQEMFHIKQEMMHRDQELRDKKMREKEEEMRNREL